MTAQRGDFERPPVLGPRFRDQLAEEPHRMVSGSNAGVGCSCGWFGRGADHAEHVLDRITELHEAAARQRAAEELRAAARECREMAPGDLSAEAEYLDARAAALAQPAPEKK